MNIGLLVILGVTSIGVYGIALAGWSSNNKYSLLGSLRSSAQLVSYELALGLSLVGVVLRAGSLNLRVIVEQQGTNGILSWNIFGGMQFVAFFIYLMAAYAETNRSPFDLPEAESELTGGYHTEYSSMKFAMFFMAEYGNMINVGCVATLLFLGGWTSPFGDLIPPPQNILVRALLPLFWFVLKVFCFLFLYVWVRGTLPRFRYDQLMNLWMALADAAGHSEHCGDKPLAGLSLMHSRKRCRPKAQQQSGFFLKKNPHLQLSRVQTISENAVSYNRACP